MANIAVRCNLSAQVFFRSSGFKATSVLHEFYDDSPEDAYLMQFCCQPEEADLILPMLEGKRPTFSGKYYRANEAMAEPRFRDHIPLMIGGSGEKKTIPLAAKHFSQFARKCIGRRLSQGGG